MPDEDKNKIKSTKNESMVDIRNRVILQTAIDGFCVVALDGRLLDVNPALCDITGYSRQELLAMKLDDLEALESPGQIKQHIEKIIKEGRDRFETKHRRKDGKILDIEVSTQFCDFEEDKFLFSFFRDITPRKQIEISKRESEEKYRKLIETAGDAIFIADAETGIIIDANKKAEKLLGIPVDSIIGMHQTELHPKEESERYRNMFLEHVQKGQSFSSENLFVLHKDGHKIPVEISAGVTEVGGKKIIHGVFRDATERKRIEAELEKYRERVSQTQKYAYVDSMGAIVAHQLNQPLTMINMLLGRALEQAKGKSCCPSVLKNVKESLVEAKNAARIISEVRQYSSNSSWVVGGAVVIGNTANRIVPMLSEKARLAKMSIFVKDMDDLPEVEITETALEQIFFIIIQNAIEAADGKKGHQLTMSAGQTGKKVELRFSDDCCGIPPENLEKIFEPFFSTKSHEGGMGLGLEIVHHILIACGGEIRVESQPGKGSTFYVTLPISSNVNT